MAAIVRFMVMALVLVYAWRRRGMFGVGSVVDRVLTWEVAL
jgi:hypothetical protein